MTLLWWHWIVLGLVLAVGELLVPSFFIIWFALGALVVGICLAVIPELSVSSQVIVWTVASIGFTVLWFKVLRKKGAGTRSGQADAVLGEVGVLVSSVEPFQRGEVRFQKPIMGAEVWPCIADSAIPAGARVRVALVDGQLLKVAVL